MKQLEVQHKKDEAEKKRLENEFLDNAPYTEPLVLTPDSWRDERFAENED